MPATKTPPKTVTLTPVELEKVVQDTIERQKENGPFNPFRSFSGEDEATIRDKVKALPAQQEQTQPAIDNATKAVRKLVAKVAKLESDIEAARRDLGNAQGTLNVVMQDVSSKRAQAVQYIRNNRPLWATARLDILSNDDAVKTFWQTGEPDHVKQLRQECEHLRGASWNVPTPDAETARGYIREWIGLINQGVPCQHHDTYKALRAKQDTDI